jgi:peptidoglycan-associated lipoprotein
MGVPEDRIRTVSYGKERPFCQADNENCWQENRRDHFVVTAK